MVNLLVTLLNTIPVSMSSLERFFSALKCIKSFSHNYTVKEMLSQLGIISIELCLLEELRKKGQFFQKVVDKFVSMN